MHICVSLALSGMSLEELESSLYAYLRESRPRGGLLGNAWKLFLRIFTRVSPSWGCPGKGLKAISMYIYVSLALLEVSLERLASNFYAYLRESGHLGGVLRTA